MIFIVDTNIVFSGLLKDSTAREILIAAPFTFLAPETMLSEIRKYEDLILQRTGLEKDEFETLFSLITENIIVVPKERYAENFPKQNDY